MGIFVANILVTGGAGFIGVHTVASLEAAGHEVLAYDNLSNGHSDYFTPSDTGQRPSVNAKLIEGDIRSAALLDQIFDEHSIDAVVHFAALIEAGESVVDPLSFYDNNMGGSLCLLAAMQRANVKRIVFSSTAAVYGQPENSGSIVEDMPKDPINPYGDSKWAVECMLRDCAAAHGLQAIALRYFNAAGSDADARFGERHHPETHLIPLALQAAAGTRPSIKIFGTDYATPDGTCIRDYIHVSDLADAHVKAVQHLFGLSKDDQPTTAGFYDAFNLGTGSGFSVRQVIDTAKRVTGVDFAVIEEARRPGDPAVLVANADKANSTFKWQPQYPDLDQMIAHAWAYMKRR